tara:strand:+ start:304 stop:2328 length:2025 start_codon:yes stop_codon:yes gene_type:complete
MAAYAIQFRRGTTTEHNSFTGLLGEVTVDTTKKSLVVHDGSTAGGFALALDGAATSTTTGTFSSNVTVGGTLAVTSTSTFGGAVGVTGDLTMTGHILPSANITYDLGSTTMMWRDVYIGPGSLYINGKKVIEDDSGTISITTDINEDLKFTTSGTGTLKLISSNGINITGELGAVSGDLQIGDHMDMNSNLIKEVATPVSTTDAANKAYVDSTAASAVTGGSNAVSGTTGTFTSNMTVGGNLTVNGTTTYIATEAITLADNILILNSNATGTPSENGGFEVERGDSLNVQFLWNETDDRWTTGSASFHAGAMISPTFTGALTGTSAGVHTGAVTGDVTGNVTGDLTGASAGVHTGAVTGNVTGNVTGDLTGAVTGDVTGNVTGDVTGNTSGSAGTVTSIAAHLLDEDNMASDSATQVPSQQSVKAYVTSQLTTQDNTDEMTEGSTNLYFTDARARGAISVSGDMSYNSSTGVISTTGLASSDTDDLSEGSSNLYYTDARADARTAVATATNTTAWEAHSDASEAAAIASAESKDVARMVTSDAYADQAELDAIASAESKDVARMVTSDAYADAAEVAAVATAATAAQVKVDALESSLTHFHSAVQSVSSAQETDNTSSSTDFTFSELTNARHYALYINRQLMRAAEYSVSGTTVTIITGILALDDELEVTGFSS